MPTQSANIKIELNQEAISLAINQFVNPIGDSLAIHHLRCNIFTERDGKKKDRKKEQSHKK